MPCSPNHNGYETWYLSNHTWFDRKPEAPCSTGHALLGGSAISWPVSLKAQQQISKMARIGI
jgi:hypothetical protein